MARQIQPSRSRVRQLRRLWPYVLMAWERWQQLPPEEKERYKKQARDYAQRGRKALEQRRKRRPR
jgi:TRAP-type C4-dicarboxylate transport system substrate-binding protein